MKKFLTLFLCVLLFSANAQAQRYTIKGSVIDMENNEPAFEATVQLLTLPDSSFVTGATTRENGVFEFHEIKKGHYAIKISSIGYLTHVQGVNIELRADANMSHIENNVTKPESPTTVGFSCGTNMQWTMPWGTEFATDMRMNSRRAYG